jgi:hypothetical protein
MAWSLYSWVKCRRVAKIVPSAWRQRQTMIDCLQDRERSRGCTVPAERDDLPSRWMPESQLDDETRDGMPLDLPC